MRGVCTLHQPASRLDQSAPQVAKVTLTIPNVQFHTQHKNTWIQLGKALNTH